MAKYQFTTTHDPEKWDQRVEKSFEGTLFQKTSFLNCYKKNFDVQLLDIKMGEHIKGGVALTTHKQKPKHSVFVSGAIHNGIFLNPDFVDSPHKSRRTSATFEILSDLVEYLTSNYDTISLRLSPQVVDVRPFLWHNYHSTNTLDKFQVNIRYTSYLDISNLIPDIALTENSFFSGLSESRRQEIRYAIKDHVRFYQSQSIDEFLAIYRQMAAAYDANIETQIPTLKECLKSLESNNALRIYFIDDSDGNKVAACAFGLDQKRAYYLHGVTSKSQRERYSGSYILWKSLESLASEQIKVVDLEGINSPNRGWFKLSFGGMILPYYQLEWSRGGPK